MAFQVNGKTALVTGGGSGICLEFTKLLVSNECNVVIADLQLIPEAQKLVDDHSDTTSKPRVVFQKTDVTDWNQLQSAFDVALEEFGSLHIVCPGAGVFEPKWSNFWNFNGGTDTPDTSSYKLLEININHPIRATQLAIDTFIRQKLERGTVVLVSSIAGQLAVFPAPLYAASKHAISGFVRSLAPLESTHRIRVNAVAPGIVKTPLWQDDKRGWVDSETDTWVLPEQIAQAMLDLIQKQENVGGTILEVGCESVRRVEQVNDPGPRGKGFKTSNIKGMMDSTFSLLSESYGK